MLLLSGHEQHGRCGGMHTEETRLFHGDKPLTAFRYHWIGVVQVVVVVGPSVGVCPSG